MLVSRQSRRWWYMEVPRTGSTTIDRGLRKVFPHAEAIYAKHWPRNPPLELEGALSLISIRNPFSRALSCWQYFTVPGEIDFADWLYDRLRTGFTEVYIEARPQAFWLGLRKRWDIVLHQERLDEDFWAAVRRIDPEVPPGMLHRFNDINGPWVNRRQARVTRNKPWQAYYNDYSTDLVLKLYAEDFEMLSSRYSRELPA